MSDFSEALLARLNDTPVRVASTRPRLLLEPDDVQAVRDRARSIEGVVDKIAERARAAAKDENLFGARLKYPLLTHQRANPLKPLATAALVLEDERFAARALEGVEIYFGFPTQQWLQPEYVDRPAPYTLFHPSSGVGTTLDLCASYWSADAARSVSDRLRSEILSRFVQVWRNQDDTWVTPDYHNNGKIVGCSNAGLTALACDGPVDDLQEILRNSLTGVLDVLDQYPPEGDSEEGATYGFGVTGFCLRFGTALKRASGGGGGEGDRPVLAPGLRRDRRLPDAPDPARRGPLRLQRQSSLSERRWQVLGLPIVAGKDQTPGRLGQDGSDDRGLDPRKAALGRS